MLVTEKRTRNATQSDAMEVETPKNQNEKSPSVELMCLNECAEIAMLAVYLALQFCAPEAVSAIQIHRQKSKNSGRDQVDKLKQDSVLKKLVDTIAGFFGTWDGDDDNDNAQAVQDTDAHTSTDLIDYAAYHGSCRA